MLDMHFAGRLGQHSFGLALRCLSPGCPGERLALSDAWTVITTEAPRPTKPSIDVAESPKGIWRCVDIGIL